MDWTLAGSVIFTGIAVVFCVLVILMLSVLVMGKIVTAVSGKKTEAPAVSVPVAAAPAAVSDEEVAVITAAVAAVLGNNNFTIHEIKRK
jgi:sodium pump decarboxylase gamma subunit